MLSLTAGSPSCNCKNPDSCIHSFTLSVGKKTYTYKQDVFASSIKIINKDVNPLSIKLKLVGKGCISNNPECPKGVIYDISKKDTLKSFTKAEIDYDVNYDKSKAKELNKDDAVSFLGKNILGKDALDWIPANKYILRVGQCQGESFVNGEINFVDGVKQILNISPRDRFMSIISIYPKYKWNVGVTIGLKQDVSELSDKTLIKEKRKENKDAGMENRDARGWTKLPRYSITDSLDIDGTISYEIGKEPPHDFSQKIKADFKKRAKDLSLLQDTTRAIGLIGKSLSTNEGKGVQFKILDTEILYPKLSINGGAELTEDDKTNTVYMKGKLSVGLKPLAGIRVTLDLLQAFAAWYGVESVTDIIRQQLAAREKAVNEGKDGAYAGLKFNLIASGTINVALAFESGPDNAWDWRVEGDNEVKFALSVEANARAGVTFTVIEGVFAIDASVEIFGKASAEGIVAFDTTAQKRIEMIFYHNGVKLEVGASASAGISKGKGRAKATNGQRVSETTSTTGTAKQSYVDNKKEWILHDKLEKEKSKWRLSML
ncbi:hypothetical protein EDF81_3868 [Enterobacter sp. BIGb0383]|uniref:hypothetical protein n=1 Tax=unclassified Enterobacter TaxID=2608935 RepID=UPI000F481DBB|nr:MULTISPECIES: hypothetical protein [unclassified Enterobacter]ROP56313.1 hypothetical protein EDF81_3868 [Enterobacter sp. BIGb0383]ROS06052.1 hypothetical protein EC848_4008 [Enterobacter sp. BIGb0359]